MLDTLRRLVEEMSGAADLDEALDLLVCRVKQVMAIDACSIYLDISGSGDLVLMATDGLDPASVGNVRVHFSEGLVGLVAKRKEPLNLEDLSAHPHYRYLPKKGDDNFNAFLGVPIVHFRNVLGVLVAQQRMNREFNDQEVDFLVTIGAQAAGAINSVVAKENIRLLIDEVDEEPKTTFVKGLKGSPGIAIGNIVVSSYLVSLQSVPDRNARDIVVEETAFKRAVEAVRLELRQVNHDSDFSNLAEVRSLFDAYAQLLTSDSLVSGVLEGIQGGKWAPAALRDVIERHAEMFEKISDPYLRARSQDIRDLGRRILMHLRKDVAPLRHYPDATILAGDDLSITDIVDVPVAKLAGILSANGSSMSHTAILARALGIPAVMGLNDLPFGRLEGRTVVVDGHEGLLHLRPSASLLNEYQRLLEENRQIATELSKLHDIPAETTDGDRVPIYVKAGLLADLANAKQSGADGVGLYRTEFEFIARESFPSEQEQYKIYRKVLENFSPQPVYLRTHDVGGDKFLPYLPTQEANAFMGWRGIRFALDHPEIFMTQLRAMLRANQGINNLKMMFPMVSTVEELDQASSLLKRAHAELLEEGHKLACPPIGVMIEVPSAVYQAGLLAERVEFLSVGTNDLTQYLLAVDRGNGRVSGLYDSLHPVVIKAVKDVVESAHKLGRSVSVCGEMTSDPAAVVLLIGAGVDSLTTTASTVSYVKLVTRSVSRSEAGQLTQKVLGMPDGNAVRHLLRSVLEEVGVDALGKGISQV